MDSRKIVFQETALVTTGQVICTGAMLAIFFLLGEFDRAALLGGIVGSILAIANFFFMAVGASLAADKAAKQDVKGGRSMIQSSFLLRHLLLFVILIACAKSGYCNAIALVLPLVFVRPALGVGEFFRKKGD